MRVTQRELITQASRSINEHLERLQKLQSIAATGKRVQKPEDDPMGTGRALGIRSHLRTMEASLRNLDLSRDWLSATETALQGIKDLLARARNLALSAADEAGQSDQAFQAWQVEVEKLLEQAVGIANSGHRGLYLFAGFKVTDVPFQLSDQAPWQVTYNGDDGAIEHTMEPGIRVQVNVPGSHPMFDKVFSALSELWNALDQQDTGAIQQSVQSIDEAMDATLEVLSVTGARVNRVDATRSRLESLQVDLKSLLSQIEDADLAETMLELNSEDLAYRSYLAASSRLFGPTLFDYLK